VFDPALRAFTFDLVPSPALRGPTNALMESTIRFARVFGPALVAIASTVLPTLQFFTLDAATFALSTASIAWISPAHGPNRAGAPPDASPRGLASTLRVMNRDPLVRFSVITGAIVGAAWWLLLPLGMELLLQERGHRDVSALATVLVAYGIGNLGSNLLVANFSDGRPERLLFAGRVIAGVGFLCFVAAPNHGLMLAAASLAAAGGPVTDVGCIGLLQSRFESHALARIYRANMAVAYSTMFVLFFASPFVFRHLGVATTFVLSATTIVLGGLWGLARFRARDVR
jgi:hypothetical protein